MAYSITVVLACRAMRYGEWPSRVLDALDFGLFVVDAADSLVYANRAGFAALEAEEKDPNKPCPCLQPVIASVLSQRTEQRNLAIIGASGDVWKGRAWPLEDRTVAVMLRRDPGRVDGLRTLSDRLGVEMPRARLAMWVTEGLSNGAIAARLGVDENTVKARLSRLYRRLGVENRAQLARLVTSSLRSD